MNPFYYLLFLLPLLFTNPLLESKEPVIIFLKGTCSSGKSTLIKSLIASRQDIEIIDEDAFVHTAYPKAVKEKFPIEYALIKKAVAKENIYHSLRTKETILKHSVTDDERKSAKEALHLLEPLLDSAKL